MKIENSSIPERSTLIIGKSGSGKTKLFLDWILSNGSKEPYSIGHSFYTQKDKYRIGFFTEHDLILYFSKSEDFEGLLRKVLCLDVLLIDELFNLYNWNNIKKQDYILSRYYAFFDFLYCHREIKVIGNSNHKITKIYPDIEDSFLRRIDEVFTSVLEIN